MNNTKKIAQLQRLLDQSMEISVRDSDNAVFKTWKNTVERTFIRVFGHDSLEVVHFKKLSFYYHPIIMSLGADYSRHHRECFDRDFDVVISSMNSYIEELQQDDEQGSDACEASVSELQQVFISHSSKDAEFVEELVDLLELIGVPRESIFCTSLAGYGIELGTNFLDAMKERLHTNTLVLFVLTQNFYGSPFCLCEMGATWVLTKDHIPILVPPFDFADVEGVIPLTQGFRINDELKLNLFKERIESVFAITPRLSSSSWERKRDRLVSRINEMIRPPL